MKQRLILVGLALLLASCQFFASQVVEKTVAPATPTAAAQQPTETVAVVATATAAAANPPTTEPVVVTNPLQADPGMSFTATVERITWQAQPYQQTLDQLPISLETVVNPVVTDGLTAAQRSALSTDGFTVLPTGEKQFADIRFGVSEVQGQPYYLTTDAAYHALHVTFDELLKALERDNFRGQVGGMVESLLEQVQQVPAAGTPIAEDTQLAVDYLAVAVRLFDPEAEIPAEVKDRIQPQIDQIMAGAGREPSKLIPNFEDDYGAYKPVGHYAGNPDLEAYFRGMTWLGRVSFKFKDPRDPNYQPSRAPLIITLALAQAGGDPDPAYTWKFINESLNFLVGPSDDSGPAELFTLMYQVYGPDVDFAKLADPSKWQEFLASVDSLPAPQINSTFVDQTADLEASRDWRLMGQRFTFDASIFQNLIYDKVGTPEKMRKFPTGPDVMAVFGSSAAVEVLESTGETDYANFPEQMNMLKNAAQSQPEEQWLSRFSSGWLYSFFPQVSPKDEAYPPYMRTSSWGYKELNSALGSWTELKHDTILYAKMPEFMAGGGPPSSGPAPAYVEPNPEVFYRLAYITKALHSGLDFRIDWPNSPTQYGIGLGQLVPYTGTLAEQFQSLGNIAAKELAGQALTEDDTYTITGCLGIIECNPEAYPDPRPVPLIAAVSGAENEVLEAAVGNIDRIFVVVPIDGKLQVAQGGVFSYYEFKQPRESRLTDEEWQQKLASGADRPAWTAKFLLPGGATTAATYFRVNDWYIITQAGGTPPLNVRQEATKSAAIVGKLPSGTYVHFLEGPVTADGLTWWKIDAEYDGIQGWVAENQDWFERAHGQ